MISRGLGSLLMMSRRERKSKTLAFVKIPQPLTEYDEGHSYMVLPAMSSPTSTMFG
jgi:hypothetical protein